MAGTFSAVRETGHLSLAKDEGKVIESQTADCPKTLIFILSPDLKGRGEESAQAPALARCYATEQRNHHTQDPVVGPYQKPSKLCVFRL
jgi:hypothetical protein